MVMITFGDLNSFDLVRHEHEAGAEDDDAEFLVGMVFFEVVEVHVFDLDVLVWLEEFLAGGDVAGVDINTEDLGVFEAVNDTFEGMTGGGSNIEDFFDRVFGIDSSFSNGLVGNPK